MSEKPAVLISDELVALLIDIAICKVSFIDLAGTDYPWEVDFNKFQLLREKLRKLETQVRGANSHEEITCVLSGDGAFWLTGDGLNTFKRELVKPNKKKKDDGPDPIWKLTTSEIILSHIGNMRQLILAVAHDSVLLEHLKESLGDNHLMLEREFGHAELTVRGLLKDIKEQGPNLSFIASENVKLMERIRITRELIEQGKLSEDVLGYSPDELDRAYKVLDERIKKKMPNYNNRLMAILSRVKESLRQGESTQLRRASRWEIAFSLMGEPPQGFRGQLELAKTERKTMMAIVESREHELGVSEAGQTALTSAQEAKKISEPTSPPPEPEPVPEPEPAPEPKPDEPQEEKKPSKEKRLGMAVLDRRGRR